MRASILVLGLTATQLGATECGGGITRDPGFDLWCGETLCAWSVAQGDVRRAATWHEADAGVELLASDAVIEQRTPVDSRDGTCIRFELVSDIDESAQVALDVDVYGDGTVEKSFPLPTTHWRQASYVFAVQAPFTAIRFAIAKHGPGRAVVARMRAAIVDTGCEGGVALDGGPAPLGALCETGEDCASAICVSASFFTPTRCAGCDLASAACGDGEVCGVAPPSLPERGVPLACIAEADKALGEQCRDGAECATGVCSAGVCSSCAASADCGGAACEPAYPAGPSLCAPGQAHAAAGEPCALDADCASQRCAGPPRQQCSDGRSCKTDAGCPVDAALAPGPCTTVGIQGGRCS